jgi:SNF2 family DNA or RNA helicase
MQRLWKDFTYFSHQEEGIEWMIDKEKNGTLLPNHDYTKHTQVYGGLQCDEMGLGKTIQIVGTLINHPKPKTIIVAPLAMVDTWISICSRAGLRVYAFEKQEWTWINQADSFPIYFLKKRPSVYITNYDKIIRNPSSFQMIFDRIVLDEAHKIRNMGGTFATAISQIKAPIRWAVTGTPLVNSYRDVVSLLDFVGMPLPRTKSGKINSSWSNFYLEQILPNILLHRSLESLRGIIDVPPLPQITEEHLPFLTQEEEKFYTGVQCVDGDSMYAMDIMSSIESFKLLLRLRQLSVHPQVYINAKRREDSTYERKDWVGPSTKFERIKQIIREDDTKKVHKYIIFCQFMEEMNMLSKELSQYNVLMYNGSLTQKQRTEVLLTSKESTETTVLLLQLQAGGVGLNLQEYDRIIFVSPWWTSALMNQAIARAVRMGQKEVVKVYHLILSQEWDNKKITNIDDRIQQKADEKQRMLEKIFQMCAVIQFNQ